MKVNTISSVDDKAIVYWEKQEEGMMTCGVHCLNTLLQGPYFDEVELAQIGIQIDNRERAIMGGKRISSKSANVSESGDYSIQVLTEALQKRGKYSIVAIGASELQKKDLTKESGFICHSSNHWFTIRKVFGVWFNLNSLAEAPYKISEFHLSAYLDGVNKKGFTVFLVRGSLSEPKINPDIMLRPYQRYLKFKELEEDVPVSGGSEQKKEDTFKAFEGKGYTLAGEEEKKSAPSSKAEINPEMEEMLNVSKAIYLSELGSKIPPEAAEKDPEAVTLNLRLPNGKTAKRRFKKTQKLEDVANFCKIEMNAVEDVRLLSSYPRKAFTDMKILIGAAFPSDSSVIVELATAK